MSQKIKRGRERKRKGTRVNWSSEESEKERDDVRTREKLIIFSVCVTTLAGARLNQMPSFASRAKGLALYSAEDTRSVILHSFSHSSTFSILCFSFRANRCRGINTVLLCSGVHQRKEHGEERSHSKCSRW